MLTPRVTEITYGANGHGIPEFVGGHTVYACRSCRRVALHGAHCDVCGGPAVIVRIYNLPSLDCLPYDDRIEQSGIPRPE